MADWIDRYIETWNGHDGTAIAAYMTEDGAFIHWWAGEWRTFRGRATIAAWIDQLVEDWSTDFVLEKTLAVVTDRAFAVEYVESGTNDAGPDATGKRFSIHSVFVGELSVGKISRITDYAGLLEYQRQVSPVRVISD